MNRLGPAATISVVTALLLMGAVAAGGCGFGPGEPATGEAQLRVTRDFGTLPMVDATLTGPTPSDTVVRFLDSNADLETSYGGNFVDSIDGYAGSTAGGGSEDWFFFVNGYYSDIGAGESDVRPGDRIWWDFRYWAAAYRVPAVIGSFPEPFLSGSDGKRPPTVVECLGERADCDSVVAALAAEGIEPELEKVARPVEHPDAVRVLVGPWEDVRADRAAREIEAGPQSSGVYGRMRLCGDQWRLEIDDDRGRPASLVSDAGLIASVRRGEDEPTWVVTGTDSEAVAEAVELLDPESLSRRYALAGAGGEQLPLPASTPASAEPEMEGCA